METLVIIEGYPDEIIARLKLRDQKRANELPEQLNGQALELVFEELRLWEVATLQVSFKGGNVFLQENIATCAAEWSKYANISFDFGYNEATNEYREWVPDDVSHIRVGFEAAGYWSFVGTDAQDPEICKPGDITLNLEKFDQELPANWKTTVLHEFGHALGFYHEHQSPVAECDFDWEKLYEYLAGPPNFWSKERVDYNLRKMPAGGLTYSPHDKYSIMHYAFPEWMFLNGKASPCFVEENIDLSTEDIRMAGKAYPDQENEQNQRRLNKRKYLEALLQQGDCLTKEKSSLWNKRMTVLNDQISSFESNTIIGLEQKVKKAILIAGGQAAEDPTNLAGDMALENLLPTQAAYQFLADLLDELVKEFKPEASVKRLEVELCITVKDGVDMIKLKI
jgi:hypothetical protein